MKVKLIFVAIAVILILAIIVFIRPKELSVKAGDSAITIDPVISTDTIVPTGNLLSFDSIPYFENDILAPGRGANSIAGTQTVNIPDPDTTIWSLDNDTRFLWGGLQPTSAGEYNWTAFDNHVKESIDHGQKFTFGIMPVCTTCKTWSGVLPVDGANLNYPLFVHATMQNEPVKDWNFEGTWIPNWNSEAFLSNWEIFLKALADHINTSSYKGVKYKNVILNIDVRGFGNWGEWHTVPWRDCNCIPPGTKPTDATIKRIIDSHIKAFPDNQLILIASTFTGEISEAMSDYALSVKNNHGLMGWRKDHWGDVGDYPKSEILNNKRTYNGKELKSIIMNRWKVAPVIGEPMTNLSAVTGNGSCPFWELEEQVRLYHVSQFSNTDVVSSKEECANNNFRAASKASGYRLKISNGSLSSNASPGDTMHLKLKWINSGIAPVYENWDTWIEMKKGNTIVWTGKSAFKPRLFLPGSKIINDDFLIPQSINPGNYDLYLIIKDPNGYRKPLPLAIKGRKKDGSYQLGSIVIDKSK